MFPRSFRAALLAVFMSFAFAGTASAADQTVEGNQFVVGKGCIGPNCSNAVAPQLLLDLKSNDTPAIRLNQSNGGGFTAQVWDVAGNEANFFVRDLTGGSRLPFRVRPGAPTSAVDILANGYVTSTQQLALDTGSSSNVNVFDTAGIVDKIGQISFETYTSTNSTNTQYRPKLADLNAQFGESTTLLNPTNVASLALAGAKENSAGLRALVARVDAIPGATDVTPLTNRVTKLEKENAKLKKDYKSLSKSLSALKKQVRKLARK